MSDAGKAVFNAGATFANRVEINYNGDYQFKIDNNVTEPWYQRVQSDGTFALHLNGTGNIFHATSSGIGVTGDIDVTSTDAGSSAGPVINLVRDSSSPADADYLGQIKFKGDDDNGGGTTYSKITGKIGDASNGSEDGIIEFAAQKAGSSTILARLTSSALKLLNSTELEAPVVDGENFKINGAQGSDGQVLTSTGSGVAWESVSGGVAGISTSADATAITIDSSERVGIGITSPEQVFHVYQAGDGKRPVRFTTGNDKDLDFYNDSEAWQLQSEKGLYHRAKGGGNIKFITGSGSDDSENERMRIDTGGKVIVSTAGSSDDIRFFVETTNSSDTGIAFGRNGTNNLKTAIRSASAGSSSAMFMKLALGESQGTMTNSSPQFTFYYNGNLTATGSVSSDRRLKENIVDIPDGSTALIKALNPVSFNLIGSPVHKAGFIAQEVETVKSSLVNGGEKDEEENETIRGVDYYGILAHAVKAIQEQQTIIDDLKSRIETLEA